MRRPGRRHRRENHRLPGPSSATAETSGDLGEFGGILAWSRTTTRRAVQLGRAVEVLEALVREGRKTFPPARVSPTHTSAPPWVPRRRAGTNNCRGDRVTRQIHRDDGIRRARRCVALVACATLVKRYNNAARVKLKVGDVQGSREMATKARALVERWSDDLATSATYRCSPGCWRWEQYRAQGSHTKRLSRSRGSRSPRMRGCRRRRAIDRARQRRRREALPGWSACVLAKAGLQPVSRRRALLEEAHTCSWRAARSSRSCGRRIDAREAAGAIRRSTPSSALRRGHARLGPPRAARTRRPPAGGSATFPAGFRLVVGTLPETAMTRASLKLLLSLVAVAAIAPALPRPRFAARTLYASSR